MYGMTETKIKKAKHKVKSNKAFLNSHGIEINNSIIPFAKFVSNSYINADRYIAELQHRAHSIHDYAKKQNLCNIFLTLTLPTEWHPMKQKSRTDKTLVFNKKFGGRKYITKINHPVTGELFTILNTQFNKDKFTPRNASKELSRMLKKIQETRQYKGIEKDNRCYFRVTEPHKDGTPHLHISLFVPKSNIDTLVSAIKNKYNSYACKIVLDVESPVHYLMKYILKTLDDLREDDTKLTALTLWYIYHGISRFYTSRTFLSLDIYRKLNGMYTLNELKDSYMNKDVSIYFYADTKDIAKIDNEHGTIYIAKPLIGEFSINQWKQDLEKFEAIKAFDADTLIEFPTPVAVKFTNKHWREDMYNEDNTYFEYEYEPLKFVENKPLITTLEHGDKEYRVREHKEIIINVVHPLTGEFLNFTMKPKVQLIELNKKPYQMKNYELQQYFNNIDIKTVNADHYAHTTNIMIDRGLLKGERLELNLENEAREVF